MTWLKNNIGFLLCAALILVSIYRHKPDNGLTQYQLDELKFEMKNVLRHEFDSLSKAVQIEIPLPNDSLQQVAIDLNKKIINEIRKKRLDNIDTISGEELRRIFAAYRGQYDMPSN